MNLKNMPPSFHKMEHVRGGGYLLRSTCHLFFIQNLYSEVKRALRNNYSLTTWIRTVIRPAWSAMDRPIPFSVPFPKDSSSVGLGDILDALGATCWGAAGSAFWGKTIPFNFFSNCG